MELYGNCCKVYSSIYWDKFTPLWFMVKKILEILSSKIKRSAFGCLVEVHDGWSKAMDIFGDFVMKNLTK